MNVTGIIRTVVKCAYRVHNKLAPGFLESLYKNAMMIELRKSGLKCRAEVPITAYYDGEIIGDFRADIVVEDCLILELKAVDTLSLAHHMQLVNYLRVTGIDDGLLINFGADDLEIKRKYRLRPGESDFRPLTLSN